MSFEGKHCIFQTTQAEKYGMSRKNLYEMTKAGNILRLERGMYFIPDRDIPYEYVSYAKAHFKFGEDTIIGGLTTLSHYNLIEEIPQRMWIILPKKRASSREYRILKRKTISREGLISHPFFCMADLERSIVEAFVYARYIGIRIACSALKQAITERQTSVEKIMRMSKKLGYDQALSKYWEIFWGFLGE